jgi:hypothetical protein
VGAGTWFTPIEVLSGAHGDLVQPSQSVLTGVRRSPFKTFREIALQASLVCLSSSWENQPRISIFQLWLESLKAMVASGRSANLTGNSESLTLNVPPDARNHQRSTRTTKCPWMAAGSRRASQMKLRTMRIRICLIFDCISRSARVRLRRQTASCTRGTVPLRKEHTLVRIPNKRQKIDPMNPNIVMPPSKGVGMREQENYIEMRCKVEAVFQFYAQQSEYYKRANIAQRLVMADSFYHLTLELLSRIIGPFEVIRPGLKG